MAICIAHICMCWSGQRRGINCTHVCQYNVKTTPYQGKDTAKCSLTQHKEYILKHLRNIHWSKCLPSLLPSKTCAHSPSFHAPTKCAHIAHTHAYLTELCICQNRTYITWKTGDANFLRKIKSLTCCQDVYAESPYPSIHQGWQWQQHRHWKSPPTVAATTLVTQSTDM